VRASTFGIASAIVVGSLGAAPGARAEEPSEPKEGVGGAPGAFSKDVGLHSPRSRRIYHDEEWFEHVVDNHRRILVMEAVAGAGPEGNLGLVLGWMPRVLKGVELYGGAGLEANPAIRLSGAARFLFHVNGYRPYVALGYFYKDAFVIETYAHNAFLEAGHSWRLGPTKHITVGLGVARLLHAGVRQGSPLRTSDVDPAKLDAQLAAIPRYLPMVAVRFSRAF
jgi:hypothetical protein